MKHTLLDLTPRRNVLKGGALGALAFLIGGKTLMLTPSEALAQGVPLRTLKADEAETLGAMGDALVPGARAAGIVQFIDQQISIPPEEALLQARIMSVRPPYANLYRNIAGAIEKNVGTRHAGKRFAALSAQEATAFINDMRQNKIADWQGPPGGGFVYAVMRADSVDVFYNTIAGYEALGVPYMPHILPEKSGESANASGHPKRKQIARMRLAGGDPAE